MSECWIWEKGERTVRFNEPRPSEQAVIFPPYDHLPSPDWHGTEAVIQIRVPAFGTKLREKAFERQKGTG